MRALLAAITCHKGEIGTNLATHLVALDEARRTRCDVAIFPELSLTGSVDALRRPSRRSRSTIRRWASVVDTTRHADYTAVFGIAERRGDELFTRNSSPRRRDRRRPQEAAPRRRRQRIRDGDRHACRTSRGARRARRVCRVDGRPTWDAAAARGADVIAMCSAPGLSGRRGTSAEWRAGLEWWESAGLADACRNARRLGVWVAMATQAGSTADEDFPGIAALVAPDGRVVDRLPDWLPGTLVVAIPRRGD
jgi:predicted amidohydrolase